MRSYIVQVYRRQEVIFLYLTKGQAAEKLGITIRTLDRYIASGKLKAHKLSPRCIRISEQDIIDFVNGGVN